MIAAVLITVLALLAALTVAVWTDPALRRRARHTDRKDGR